MLTREQPPKLGQSLDEEAIIPINQPISMAIILHKPPSLHSFSSSSSSSSSQSKFISTDSYSPLQVRCHFPNRQSPNSSAGGEALTLLHQFNPSIPIERALTLPSTWYTDPSFLALELDRVFCRGWQAVGTQTSPSFWEKIWIFVCVTFGCRENVGNWKKTKPFWEMQVRRRFISCWRVRFFLPSSREVYKKNQSNEKLSVELNSNYAP